MAIEDSWGPGTNGEHAQTGAYEPKARAAAKTAVGFKPVNPKAVTPAQREQQVQNVVHSVQAAATPSERRGGAQWYQRAHREAATLAAGANPLAPGRTRRAAKKAFGQLPESEQRARTNQSAGVLARLSPSGGGMTWEKSVPAAHELGKMTDAQVDQVSRGNRSSLAGKNLRFASNRDIVSAHTIHTGENKPEDVLPMKLKTGHFYKNIAEPGKGHGATIDARSHDIALGERHTWDTNRGLQSAGRYKHFEDVHTEAAHRLGMSPEGTQATSWVADKRAALQSGQGVDTSKMSANQGVGGLGARRRGGKTV